MKSLRDILGGVELVTKHPSLFLSPGILLQMCILFSCFRADIFIDEACHGCLVKGWQHLLVSPFALA
jgi:hypothetical protein